MKSLLLIASGLVLLVLGGCETQRTQYASTEEARNDGLFSRGWAPDVLPDNAGPITEAHDLDTNARCLYSAFPPDSLRSVRSELARLGFSESDALAPEPAGFCPFSGSDLSDVQETLSRKGQASDLEYVALHEGGTLYFWSSRDASP